MTTENCERGFHALVIDDDATMRMAISGILKKELDFEKVVEAPDGLAGLRQLKTGTFDIVLLDWMMPVMDGCNFLKAVRQNPLFHDLKIIMITSKRSLDEVKEAKKLGVTDYIVKPPDMETLVKKVTHALQMESVSHEESVFLQKARLACNEGKYADALRNYRKALEIVPARRETVLKIAEIEIGAGNVAEADDILKKTSREKLTPHLSRDMGYLYCRVGDHYYDRNDFPEAEDRYSEAIKINPKQRDAYTGLGCIEMTAGNATGAREYFDMALNLDIEEDDIRLFNQMAIRQRRNGRPEEAVRILERAVRHFSNDAALYYNLGRAYMDISEKKKALKSFRAALEISPSLAEAKEMMAMLTDEKT